jgi:hypothetical protein
MTYLTGINMCIVWVRVSILYLALFFSFPPFYSYLVISFERQVQVLAEARNTMNTWPPPILTIFNFWIARCYEAHADIDQAHWQTSLLCRLYFKLRQNLPGADL